ncbi:phage virion morphogenesis protein [Pseudoxanthomonas winnipegensis]|uniref:phage virion morphogenesis protein n=1 Tax=Pseudoxanthomonas winnipegensis TaxID=2480810 RepID=UPI0010386A66|nr:phage virion morphogenesis protein [Pseudoxanthomonas winnipegensis]TBV76870.1 phage virion morphogenesis protein [Pseudoxanthomonas winnipegensis]
MNPAITLEDTRVTQWLARLRESGRNPRPALVAIGRYGKTSTQLRFRRQVDPAGRRWWPSLRARKQGGQTLRDTNRLFQSITWSVGPGYAEWGTNVAYAAAHNFGVRKMVTVGAHQRNMKGVTRTGRAWAKRVQVRSFVRLMFLPRRQFLGFNQADRDTIREILADFVQGTATGPVGG